MKIAVDTNVIARAILQDDPQQGAAAARLLSEVSLLAVSMPSLCELVWILRRGAKLAKEDIVQTIRDLLNTGIVVMNRSDDWNALQRPMHERAFEDA